MRGEPFRPRINEPSPPRDFHRQFQLINRQNQELIILADNITRSTFMQPSCPHIIAQLEQQLRKNLSIFVDSIREFFVDMDTRLRALAQAFDQQIKREEQQHRRKRMITMQEEDPRSRQFNTNYGFRNLQIQTDPYHLFSQKISALQISLKQTQENQGKLIQMVERISKKSENLASMGPQPEPPRYLRPELKPDIVRHTSNNSFEREHQSSFRLFSLKNKKKENHPVERVTSSSPMVCGSLAVTESRNNFGQVYPQNIIDSTHNYNHRVNFMLRTLNS